VTNWEVEFTAKGGESCRQQWRVRAFFDDRGHLVDCQAVGLDLTERKRAEEGQRLLEAQRSLAEVLTEADRRKNDFPRPAGSRARSLL
jgi:hypothetical protein